MEPRIPTPPPSLLFPKGVSVPLVLGLLLCSHKAYNHQCRLSKMLHTATTCSRRVAASSPTILAHYDITIVHVNVGWCESTHHSRQKYLRHNMNAALALLARSPARSEALNCIEFPQELVHSKLHLPLS